MGMILCLLYIAYIWHKYYDSNRSVDGRFNYMLLQSATALERQFPSDPGFWSLRWSVIRRFAVTVVIALLVYFVNNSILSIVLLSLNLLTVVIVAWSQAVRFRSYRRSTENVTDCLRPVVRVCISTAIYAIFTQICLYAVYAFRP